MGNKLKNRNTTRYPVLFFSTLTSCWLLTHSYRKFWRRFMISITRLTIGTSSWLSSTKRVKERTAISGVWPSSPAALSSLHTLILVLIAHWWSLKNWNAPHWIHIWYKDQAYTSIPEDPSIWWLAGHIAARHIFFLLSKHDVGIRKT